MVVICNFDLIYLSRLELSLLKISIGNNAGAFSMSENIGCLASRCLSSSSRDI